MKRLLLLVILTACGNNDTPTQEPTTCEDTTHMQKQIADLIAENETLKSDSIKDKQTIDTLANNIKDLELKVEEFVDKDLGHEELLTQAKIDECTRITQMAIGEPWPNILYNTVSYLPERAIKCGNIIVYEGLLYGTPNNKIGYFYNTTTP